MTQEDDLTPFQKHLRQLCGLGQPIPQDINNFILKKVELLEKLHHEITEDIGDDISVALNSLYQLLLSELQQLREENEKLKSSIHSSERFRQEDAIEHNKELQEYKEQLAQAKKELDVMIGNDLRQEKEIKSLKQGNENYKKVLAELVRCYPTFKDNLLLADVTLSESVNAWEQARQTIKQQTHG